MARNNKLKDVAVKIGSAAGRIDGKTHKAAHVAKKELDALTRQVDALKKQLKKSTENLKSALR
jgi:polyhydroxyalkanoate synthesis regulator phasin